MLVGGVKLGRRLRIWGAPLLIAGLTVGIAIIVANLSGGGQRNAPTQALAGQDGAVGADAQVRAAVEKALRTHQTLAVPPNAAGMKAAGPSAADLQLQATEAAAAANDAFGPDLATKEL